MRPMVGKHELIIARAHSTSAQNEFWPLESAMCLRIELAGQSDGTNLTCVIHYTPIDVSAG